MTSLDLILLMLAVLPAAGAGTLLLRTLSWREPMDVQPDTHLLAAIGEGSSADQSFENTAPAQIQV